MKQNKKTSGRNRNHIFRKSLTNKLVAAFAMAILLAFGLNLLLTHRVNQVMLRMEQAYQSNISISEMQDTLTNLQNSLYEYLNGDYDSLKRYYSEYSKLKNQIDRLNSMPSDDETDLLEKNIRNMCNTYLTLADEAVSGHRGTDIEQYTTSYEDATVIYGYLEANIYELNARVFDENTNSYLQLSQIQNYNQKMNMAFLLLAALVEILVIILVTGQLIKPLSNLAERAELVGQGELDMPPLPVNSSDEVGQVTSAFNQMTASLGRHIEIRQEQLREENRLKQEQLQLEAYLKDSQLGALQAQINPHFLYNTLNAGSQLALIEDAEQTCVFLEHVADYFRYNLHRAGSDAFLQEEIDQVEHYLFIMNTRFAGEIHYHKDLPSPIPSVRLPGMILQPIVENAIEHGLKEIEGEKQLELSVSEEADRIVVAVSDNGKGFDEAKAQQLLSDMDRTIKTGDGQHGIGMSNVITRLRLYYDRDEVMEIGTREDGTGTQIRILIPKEEKADA